MDSEISLVAMTPDHRADYEAWLAGRGLRIGPVPLPPNDDPAFSSVAIYLVSPVYRDLADITEGIFRG